MYKTFRYALLLIILGVSSCRGLVESPFTDTHRARAEDVFDDTVLSTSLAQILAWHQMNRTEIPDALNPGIDRASILAAFSDLHCQPTEELIQLWTWHNGTQYSPVPLIWYHDFLSVEDAISEYKQLTLNPLIVWGKNWIPIFSFQGEWYFVECYEEARVASPVGYLFLENTEVYYTYLSLTRMLETAAAWFQQGAVFWDNESWGLGDDIKEVFAIHQKLNEGAHFPYHVE